MSEQTLNTAEQKNPSSEQESTETAETAYLFVSIKDKTKVDVYLNDKKIGQSSRPLLAPIGTHTFMLKNPITGAEKSVTFTVRKKQNNKIVVDDI